MASGQDLSVQPPHIPMRDRSGAVGSRMLALLDWQVSKTMSRWIGDGSSPLPEYVDVPGPYGVFILTGTAYACGILGHFGEHPSPVNGWEADSFHACAAMLMRSAIRLHPLGGHGKSWSLFNAARKLHGLGMGAWLVWEQLDARTREPLCRILIYEADRYLGRPAPARLYDDTQAESNAWTGGGLAVTSCMLRHHPHREEWEQKAREYMISAYATTSDTQSAEFIDGKPLQEWLTKPNAFPDHSVENHGFVHPDYMAAFSEMVRGVVAYRLADEPVPEAPTHRAAAVFDRVMQLSLPDCTHLYIQGTDYTARRIDSLWQACGIVPLRPNPLRKAQFLRCLAALENRRHGCPDQVLSGWLGMEWDLGTTWGLTQNYMLCRMFGLGGDALSDQAVEDALAGTHVSEEGCYAVRRTPRAITSVSWHARRDPPCVMALTMSLDKDCLAYPMPRNLIGDVRESDGQGGVLALDLDVVSHRVFAADSGLAVLMQLAWCGGAILQDSAVVCLPDDRTVVIERRTQLRDIAVAHSASGSLTLFDDTAWPAQTGPRRLLVEDRPVSVPHQGAASWFTVDKRLGCAVLGRPRLSIQRVAGQPSVWRGDNTIYGTLRLEFDSPRLGTLHSPDKDGAFGMIICTGEDAQRPRQMAEKLNGTGWIPGEPGVYALDCEQYLAYANVADERRVFQRGPERLEVEARSAGWIDVG